MRKAIEKVCQKLENIHTSAVLDEEMISILDSARGFTNRAFPSLECYVA